MTIKLYCIPYAGASAVIFNKWKLMMDDTIEIIPMELASRGRRLGEPFYKNIEAAVNDLYKQLSEQVDTNSFAIFGHSMGAIIGFELTKRLCEIQRVPQVLFCSGRKAPQLCSREPAIHHLKDKEFIKKVIELGATPAELFESQEISDIFLPILRSDFQNIEEYRYQDTGVPIGCDLAVLFGEGEGVSLDELNEWRYHTTKEYLIQSFEGGHFFIHDSERDVVNYINQMLTRR